MAKKKFEFKVDGDKISSPEIIEAEEFELDMKNGKLTFMDENNDNIASYSVLPGAWVKRVSK